ncbi:hypothetical protein GOBAR_AA35711 [Gossypium barbadense]|uniref:Uncharacterized protein n=1 Tax=Gossypium barbadense TaxID=3634 RepID=A0A2P5W1N2_GOSBA|nr:hypothetical protein GOBAR_AA35711 [Gossypium barbadense]
MVYGKCFPILSRLILLKLSALPFHALKTMKRIAEVVVNYRDPLDMRNRNGPPHDMKATQVAPFFHNVWIRIRVMETPMPDRLARRLALYIAPM